MRPGTGQTAHKGLPPHASRITRTGGHQAGASGETTSVLPRLLLIADGFATGRSGMDAEAVQERIVRLVATGVRWVQLRDHGSSLSVIANEAARFGERLRSVEPSVRIAVNTHLEVARALGTDLHVGQRGPSVAEARVALPDAFLSAAVHSLEEAIAAARAGADAVLFSPVFSTSSKPDAPATGLEMLATVCQAVSPVPVLALGGVTPERAGACVAAGAFGVAVLSGLLDAENPDDAVAAYLRALQPPTP
jgi:thiamine-phosphate pyrophosphorylase